MDGDTDPIQEPDDPSELAINFISDPTYAGWQLARVEPGVFTSVRHLSDEEFADATIAIAAVRKRVQAASIRLLDGSREHLVSTLDSIPLPGNAPTTAPGALLEQISVPLVSWLLIWRLHRDQSGAEISSRATDSPSARARFETVKRDVYDSHPGYRLTEAMRDYVQHKASPPIHVELGVRRQPSGEILRHRRVTVLASTLLEWKKCPASVRADLQQSGPMVELREVIDDAMTGMQIVTNTYLDVLLDQFHAELDVVLGFIDATAPFPPILLRTVPKSDGGHQISATRFEDIFVWAGQLRM